MALPGNPCCLPEYYFLLPIVDICVIERYCAGIGPEQHTDFTSFRKSKRVDPTEKLDTPHSIWWLPKIDWNVYRH
jgi:hypothetical protein